MWAYIFRNIAQRLVLLFFVSILAHSVIHLAPGEPSQVDASNPRMKPEDIARIRAAFHRQGNLHWASSRFRTRTIDVQPRCS